ncbi:MAG: Na-translocating system protein MpsB, partial [Firmicutes bacterium]|nr:Na-translocating system protein MpsB [Bacillota bacterium]
MNEWDRLLEWMQLFSGETRAQIWLEAFEANFRCHLLQRLAGASRTIPQVQKDRSIAQVVFCIDVRSEGFRRHLEAVGPYETLGTAGFFGVPLRFRSFLSEEDRHLYPPLLSADPLIVVEEIRTDQLQVAARNTSITQGKQWLDRIIAALKYNLMAPFTFIESSGWLWGMKAVSKTLAPRATGQFCRWLGERINPPAKTFLSFGQGSGDQKPIPTAHGMLQDFSLEGQARMVKDALSVMGMTRDFSRLVLFMGHGSHSENNPYASALNCGAAGGHHSGANARALAQMANNPKVRRLLKQQGLMIPDDTLFLAGEHDTATDAVALYDQDTVPHAYRQEFSRLRRALHQAGMQNAQERCLTLP